ncbi:MAG: YggS family pyridoxal phosphate-dependent enzyme [Planctomycetota bacterium]|nr:YggS family pyridoxal phosphate-dependent enzyme [Planctomycetota bacterium]
MATTQDPSAGSEAAKLLAPTLAGRWQAVRDRIAVAAKVSGRSPEQVMLVVVTKTAAMDQVRELVMLGQRDFAENRVQRLVQRSQQIEEFVRRPTEMRPGATPPTIRWHMIGSLQRNKVKKAIEVTRLIHSVDTLRLAEELQTAAAKRTDPVDVLVEANIAGEANKHGVAAPALRHFIEQVAGMHNIRVRGLMTMAPNTDDRDALRALFTRTAEFFHDIRTAGVAGARFDILSMGMSNDYELAVECGANVVRIGSAIIGPPTVQSLAEEANEQDESP